MKGEELKKKINRSPKITLKKRTWHYIQDPWEYEVKCDKCGGNNVQWSEFEKFIWCKDCKIDTKGTEGVFGGPIPIEAAGLLGMCFDRWDMRKKKIIVYDRKKKKDLYLTLKQYRTFKERVCSEESNL